MLIKEIEKLRLEQTEDKKRFAENEKLTAQLGRQLAEQRNELKNKNRNIT